VAVVVVVVEAVVVVVVVVANCKQCDVSPIPSSSPPLFFFFFFLLLLVLLSFMCMAVARQQNIRAVQRINLATTTYLLEYDNVWYDVFHYFVGLWYYNINISVSSHLVRNGIGFSLTVVITVVVVVEVEVVVAVFVLTIALRLRPRLRCTESQHELARSKRIQRAHGR
jgi:hypothetical protein